jgi:bidirectional [NiFe] hydrogenase diaphorase subunit
MSVLTVTINGQMVSAREGQTVLDVARDHDIRIPTLCNFTGLSNIGACRLCLVQINESPKLQPACVVKAENDMRVVTDTEQLRGYRRSIIEMLLSERNHICAVCVMSGDCELQSVAAELGVTSVRYEYLFPKLEVDATHDKFVLDHNRCILCMRCVRTCAELEGAHKWDIGRRGINARVVTDLNQSWGKSLTCTSCGKCVNACPTGALSVKGATVHEMKKERAMLRYLLEARQTGQYDLDLLAPRAVESVASAATNGSATNGSAKKNGATVVAAEASVAKEATL